MLLFFKRLCARIYDKTITRPRIDSYFGSTPLLGPFSSRFTLVRFQAWKVDGGVSVVSNGRVWSDRHGCYGSGSGSQGVEPRHVTSLAHPSNVERHRASGRWFETIHDGC